MLTAEGPPLEVLTAEGPPLEVLTRRLADCPPEFLAEPRTGARGAVNVAAVVSDLLVALGGAPLTKEQAEPFQRSSSQALRSRLRLILIACWLLDDPWFRAQGGRREVGGSGSDRPPGSVHGTEPEAGERAAFGRPLGDAPGTPPGTGRRAASGSLPDDAAVTEPGTSLADRALALLRDGLDAVARVVSAEKFVSDSDRREELARLALGALSLRPAGETDAQAADRLTTLSSAERQTVVQAARAAEDRARAVRAAIAARKAAAEADAKAIRE